MRPDASHRRSDLESRRQAALARWHASRMSGSSGRQVCTTATSSIHDGINGHSTHPQNLNSRQVTPVTPGMAGAGGTEEWSRRGRRPVGCARSRQRDCESTPGPQLADRRVHRERSRPAGTNQRPGARKSGSRERGERAPFLASTGCRAWAELRPVGCPRLIAPGWLRPVGCPERGVLAWPSGLASAHR